MPAYAGMTTLRYCQYGSPTLFPRKSPRPLGERVRVRGKEKGPFVLFSYLSVYASQMHAPSRESGNPENLILWQISLHW